MLVHEIEEAWAEGLAIAREHPRLWSSLAFLSTCARLASGARDLGAAQDYYGGLLRWGSFRSAAHDHLGRLAEDRGDEAAALDHDRGLLMRMERADTELSQLEHART